MDIGSNSVRLVIYDVFGAHFTPVYNEKILAGLGRDLRRTGRLSESGKTASLAAIARFIRIARARNLPPLLVGATAALRMAEDAPDFVAEVLRQTGLDISPISGAEEARLSALGLMADNHRRIGLAADLGGASLELMRVGPELVEGDQPVQGVSLPLGPFDVVGGDLRTLSRADYEAIIPQLHEALAKLPLYLNTASGTRRDTLYLIGGAWRNLAAVHQMRIQYPMRTLQGYKMDAEAARDLGHWAWTEGREALLEWPGMRRARAETLPYAGLMLEQLIARFEPRDIVISMTGLREGLVWDRLPTAVRSRDPLIDGCRDFARGSVQAEHFGTPLMRFLAPILPRMQTGFAPEDKDRLIRAACHLAGLGKNLHPDYRAELVFENVLYAPVAGLTHIERAFLSLTLFRTYASKREAPEEALLDALLSEAQRESAALIGEAIRLAIVATGRTPGLLDDFTLVWDGPTLKLNVTPEVMSMVTEQVRYRLEKLNKRISA